MHTTPTSPSTSVRPPSAADTPLTTTKKLASYLTLASLFLALWAPLHLWDHLPRRLLPLLVGLAACFWIIRRPLPTFMGVPLQKLALFALAVAIPYTLAYAYSIGVRDVATGIRDLLDLFRPFFWVATLIMVAGLRLRVHQLSRYLSITLAAVTLAFLAVYLDVPYIGDFLEDTLYAVTKQRIRGLLDSRLAMPLNANHLGFLVVMASSFLLFYGTRRQALTALPLGCVLVWLTGSRTAWAGMVVLLAVYGIALLFRETLRGKPPIYKLARAFILLLCLVSSITIVLTLLGLNPRADDFVSGRTEPVAAINSEMQGRYELWQTALDAFTASPLIGWGPTKYSLLDSVDNQYLLWLARNGLLGVGIILAGASFVLRRLWRLAPRRWHRLSLVAFLASSLVMLNAGSFLDNSRIFIVIAFMLYAVYIHLQELYAHEYTSAVV